ncbi:MAG: ABC transporter ATP-binding protein [Cyanobacteria bacterium P01_D01_bin.105]
MVAIDERRWPVVSVCFQGTGTPADMTQFYSRFEEWLSRKEKFALVLQRTDAEAAEAADKKSAVVRQMRKDGIAWTKAHKPTISQYCMGIAIVPDSAKLLKLWGPIIGKVTKNMYGCPGKVFLEWDNACDWAVEQLQAGQLNLDKGTKAVAGAAANNRANRAASRTASGQQSINRLILRQRLFLALSALFAVIGAALGLVPYYLIYLVSLRLFGPSASADVQTVGPLAWWAIAAVVSKSLFIGLSTKLSHIAAYTILYDLRIELAYKLACLPLGYFTGRTTGEIKKIIHEDVEQLEQGLAHLIPDVVSGLAVPLIAGTLLALTDWRMTLATLASGVVAILLFGFTMSHFDMSAYNNLLAKMNGAVIQYINGMKVIKAFTRTDASFDQLQTVVEEIRQVYVKTTRVSALPMAFMLTLMRSAAVTVVPVGIALYLTGSLSVPTFVLFVVMGLGFNRPIMAVLFHGVAGFYQVNSASKRIAAVFDQPALAEPAQPKQPTGNGISFKDVSFSYGETLVLNQISFMVPAGSVTALVGPSGAGKSTIAKLIPRFWDVSSGEISIGGVNIQEIAVERLMRQVSFVFQDVFLFNDTVLENIRMGKPNATRSEIAAAAKAARCHDFIEALPQGYDTCVGENGVSLSGGQRQRLSIARALLKDAPIIVLDEATAYVDPENEMLVQQAIAALLENGNKTLIVVAHRLSTITEADQILVLDQGTIVAQGTHESLLEHCDLYREQWQAHTTAQMWQLGDAPKDHVIDNNTAARQYSDVNQYNSVNQIEKSAAVDQPLENPYKTLNETDSAWTMVRKLIPPSSTHYLWRTARWRCLESITLGITSYVVYLLLVALFQAESTGLDSIEQSQLWRYVAAITGLCLAQIVCGYKANIQAYALTIAVQTKLRLFLAEYIRRLPLGFFTQREVGTVDALFTTNVMYLEPHQILESLISAVITPILIFVVMFVLDWRLALVLASSMPFAILALRYGDIVFARVWRKQAEARVQANARMVEYIQGIAVIRAFNLAGDRLQQFRSGLSHYRQASLETVTELTPALVAFLGVLELGFAALLVVGSTLFTQGSLSGDRFLLFMILGLAFYLPLIGMANMMEFYRLMQNCIRNLNEFLHSPLLPAPQTPQPPKSTQIEFKNVSFSYDGTTRNTAGSETNRKTDNATNSETILDGVSFTIPTGAVTALVGPSGSGKTTITNLIARFWDVTEGKITLGGVDIRAIDTNTLLSQMTMVFQDVYLFQDTVYNNIQYGKTTASESEVIAAAKAAQCHQFIIQLPHGYQTVLGEGGATLSGGEKQRISIARAILKDAPIVLLDEATASIDPENERLIQQALQALSARKTLIVIAHRLTTIAAADQILVLDQGRVVEQGTHASLMAQAGVYARLWAVKSRSQSWKLAAAS